MKIIMIGLLVVLITGCSYLLSQPSSAVHDLGYANPTPNNTTRGQQVPIIVAAPRWLDDNRIRYRLLYAAPTQVRFYSLDRWIAPPPELFQQLLTASGKQWPGPLTIHLGVFEQQFAIPNQAKAVMQFTVTTTPPDNNQKTTTREFHLQQPCPTPDAKGAVTAFSTLTKQAADQVQAWLVQQND